jgi:uncharacterized protein
LGRLIFFLLLGLLAWWLVRGLTRSKLKHDQDKPSTRVEDMVACARCGVNLPRSDAREEAGKYFCLDNPHCRP